MSALSREEIDQFWRDGYLMVENAVTPAELAALRDDFAGWVAECADQADSWGEIMDGRARFDVALDRSGMSPTLRRVNAPIEVSDAYFEVMRDSRVTACVAALIGPNVKFHHSKINSKLPGSDTEVKWHQDFPFTPHSNDDVITALLMVDEVTHENGPLEVVPGSHRGAIEPLWHNGRFTGAASDQAAAAWQRQAVRCTGQAGSVCLMHTRLAHGSTPNRSARPRTLFIMVYAADDAVALTPNPVPNCHDGLLVSGTRSGQIRSQSFDVAIPEFPAGASFFLQQLED
jgi:ectoine hydroxylase-related dioxygenase (phytanoyl-CoA dioxygenase family)